MSATPRPLRVLHLAHVRWFNAEVQYALDLALAMRQRGHAVALLAESGSPGAAQARAAGVETLEEAGFNAKGLGTLRVLPAALRLARLLRRRAFDAVEVHRPEGLPLVVWACRRAGVPAVRVRGDMRPLRADPFNRWLHTRLLAQVVASNERIAASLRRRLGPRAQVTTVHGGVDAARFTPEGPAENVRAAAGLGQSAGPLVGILGRLGPVKGHEHFLGAARRVLDAGVEASFVILAKTWNHRGEQFRAQVAGDPVLRGRVGFLDHCADLPAVLRAFDLGVVASVGSEANCRVGLEWMASAVPLVASDVGVLPDLVVPGRTGSLVPAADAGALAVAIGELAGQPERARRLGEAARERVLAGFTTEHCARAHEEIIYRNLAEDRSPCRVAENGK